MLGAGALFLWWRGPGWRGIGLRRPDRWGRAVAIGGVLSLYQFASLYVVEPLLARLTSGELPDVTMFASLVGDEWQLVFWLAISWTVAAFMEELVFRGWLTARLAESIGPVHSAWVFAVVLSSMVFGLSHLYQGLSGMLATGISGLLFGAAYLATGRNLWGAILAHGLTDTIGFVMIYLGIYPGLS
jgi:CAAX protease family protein